MCGLFDKPKVEPPNIEKPPPFVFANEESKSAKSKKKGISALTVDLNTGTQGSSGAGLTIT